MGNIWTQKCTDVSAITIRTLFMTKNEHWFRTERNKVLKTTQVNILTQRNIQKIMLSSELSLRNSLIWEISVVVMKRMLNIIMFILACMW